MFPRRVGKTRKRKGWGNSILKQVTVTGFVLGFNFDVGYLIFKAVSWDRRPVDCWGNAGTLTTDDGQTETVNRRLSTGVGQPAFVNRRRSTGVGLPASVNRRLSTGVGQPVSVNRRLSTDVGQPAAINRRRSTGDGQQLPESC